ncbi:hypothetical protein [Levilactobacillus angrenensis]|uniref:hypothetical protein n=1 Tax=Levilactobacillus angrenensis TaxID=2486020 RepID=UPI000F7913A5|nr:hypothetical protein [Levilactobacillus angrenensis]
MQEDVSDILAEEAVPLYIEPSASLDGAEPDDLGQLVPREAEPYDVNEPLIPASLNTNMQAVMSQELGGQVVTYDAFWYSQRIVPEGSHVTVKGSPKIRYKVLRHTGFQAQGGFIVYGLGAIEDD